jgi:hypothetical protein
MHTAISMPPLSIVLSSFLFFHPVGMSQRQTSEPEMLLL